MRRIDPFRSMTWLFTGALLVALPGCRESANHAAARDDSCYQPSRTSADLRIGTATYHVPEHLDPDAPGYGPCGSASPEWLRIWPDRETSGAPKASGFSVHYNKYSQDDSSMTRRYGPLRFVVSPWGRYGCNDKYRDDGLLFQCHMRLVEAGASWIVSFDDRYIDDVATLARKRLRTYQIESGLSRKER